MTRAQWEYTIAAAILGLLLLFLVPALVRARAEVRDDLRRADMANLKHAAEMYYNQHVFYPTPPDTKLGCTEAGNIDSWLFGNTSPLLKEHHIDAIPHDVREARGHTYRYCVTDIQNQATAGYFFETQLEVEQPATVAHDFDEGRNYGFRVLHENGKILYRVCGGIETQCTPVES